MAFFESLSKQLATHFEKGKPLHSFYSLFDAIDTFILTPNTLTVSGSHVRDHVDMKRIMITVIFALFPTLLFGLWNVGYQHYTSLGETVPIMQAFWYGFLKWLPMVIVVYVSGLTVEIIFAQKRGHQVAEGFFVTGMIIPLIMPPDLPLWILAIATIFSVIFAVEVFGGTGYNFLNPALIARAFVFFAYPTTISGDKVWIAEIPDTYSGATPLSIIANGNISSLPDTLQLFIGNIPGCIGETSKIAILLGACLLIITQVANWRIMLSVIVGGAITILLFNAFDLGAFCQISVLQQLMMGGFLFGAVFMATDPVSSAHTPIGKIIYGLLIGIFAILIRNLNKGYPEGMMLAILLMNIFAPLIDYIVIQYHIKYRKNRNKLISTNKPQDE